MNAPEQLPVYLQVCRKVQADALIAGIAPTDQTEEGTLKTRQLIEQHCQEQGVDVFAFTAWLHN